MRERREAEMEEREGRREERQKKEGRNVEHVLCKPQQSLRTAAGECWPPHPVIQPTHTLKTYHYPQTVVPTIQMEMCVCTQVVTMPTSTH